MPFNFGQSFLEQMNAGQQRATNTAELNLRAKQVQENLLTEQVKREMMRAQQSLAEADLALREREVGVKENISEAQIGNINADTKATLNKMGLTDARIEQLQARTELTGEQILSEINDRGLTDARIEQIEAATGLTKERIISETINQGLTKAQIENVGAETLYRNAMTAQTALEAEFLNENLEAFKNQQQTFTISNGLGEPFGIEDGTTLSFDRWAQIQQMAMESESLEMKQAMDKLRRNVIKQNAARAKKLGEYAVKAYNQRLNAANKAPLSELLEKEGYVAREPLEGFLDLTSPNPLNENRFSTFPFDSETPKTKQKLQSIVSDSSLPAATRQGAQKALDAFGTYNLHETLENTYISGDAFMSSDERALQEAATNLGRGITRNPQAGQPFVAPYGSAAMGLPQNSLLGPVLQGDAMGKGFQLAIPQMPTNLEQ